MIKIYQKICQVKFKYKKQIYKSTIEIKSKIWNRFFSKFYIIVIIKSKTFGNVIKITNTAFKFKFFHFLIATKKEGFQKNVLHVKH